MDEKICTQTLQKKKYQTPQDESSSSDNEAHSDERQLQRWDDLSKK
jgi:hypothetical protein